MRPTKRIAILLALLIAITVNAQEKPHILLVIHGEASTITRGSMTSEMEKQYRDKWRHHPRPQRQPAMPFNSEGMYRGWTGPDGVPHVAIYKD